MTPIEQVLEKYKLNFSPVVPFTPGLDRLLGMDFTANNMELTAAILSDTRKFSEYITGKLVTAGAKFGVGGYNEFRELYSRSKVFESAQDEEEPRRLHLGMDIWGRPYTPVRAPINGIIHSFGYNNRFGDYGATLILSHNLDGMSFHTLYGHLSLNSIKNLREGDNVRAADVIGEFGIPQENGQWPPHLHFQTIVDMGRWNGDYPGVCKYSERDEYLKNCPDPDLILAMRKHTVK